MSWPSDAGDEEVAKTHRHSFSITIPGLFWYTQGSELIFSQIYCKGVSWVKPEHFPFSSCLLSEEAWCHYHYKEMKYIPYHKTSHSSV